MPAFYSIDSVLAVARCHPFYNHSIVYPPSQESITEILASTRSTNQDVLELHSNLREQPLLNKDMLYAVVDRLLNDTSPSNLYRKDSYISTTGGGSGKNIPMLFLTDRKENRSQRAAMAELTKSCRLADSDDWVLNLHTSGFLYRALDLTTEMLEAVGASVLCAGHLMPHEKLFEACQKYNVNVLTGDSSQILNFVHWISSLPSGTKSHFQINKIVYTCEPLPAPKRAYLSTVLGSQLEFSSMLASAETGPWAVAVLPSPLGNTDRSDDAVDFIYDARTMIVEVLLLSSDAIEPDIITKDIAPSEADWAPEGTKGHLVLTSLQRLKNPLIRYISGDIGSVHALPTSSTFFSSHPMAAEAKGFLRVLRLHGRDQRFSFKWLGEYFDFGELSKELAAPCWGILQWQIIIANDTESAGSDVLELRIMRAQTFQKDGKLLTAQENGYPSTLENRDDFTSFIQAVGVHENPKKTQNSKVRNSASNLKKCESSDLDSSNLNGEHGMQHNVKVISDEELKETLKCVFYLNELNSHLFKLSLLENIEGFERAETSRKVVKFIDRRVLKGSRKQDIVNKG
ncbi:MAG: hypothetical protein L6R41_005648 [Letrouitia leprolyta]|nr:MAG: hypothetical protein L6R41_005648 [Letrouitia leprolyta]